MLSLFTPGMDKTIQRGDMHDHGLLFKIIPKHNDPEPSRKFTRSCWIRKVPSWDPIRGQSVIPTNLAEFKVRYFSNYLASIKVIVAICCLHKELSRINNKLNQSANYGSLHRKKYELFSSECVVLNSSQWIIQLRQLVVLCKLFSIFVIQTYRNLSFFNFFGAG